MCASLSLQGSAKLTSLNKRVLITINMYDVFVDFTKNEIIRQGDKLNFCINRGGRIVSTSDRSFSWNYMDNIESKFGFESENVAVLPIHEALKLVVIFYQSPTGKYSNMAGDLIIRRMLETSVSYEELGHIPLKLHEYYEKEWESPYSRNPTCGNIELLQFSNMDGVCLRFCVSTELAPAYIHFPTRRSSERRHSVHDQNTNSISMIDFSGSKVCDEPFYFNDFERTERLRLRAEKTCSSSTTSIVCSPFKMFSSKS